MLLLTVNLITGNKYQKQTDYQSPSSRLSWQRHYNSSNSVYDFGMGRGWAGQRQGQTTETY